MNHICRSVCFKMLKFFACYIWLILGFLTAFMILMSTKRIFQNFPISVITMLVWMTGELDYVGILYPQNEEIHLLKHKDEDDEPHYVGHSQKTEDTLQFAGKIYVFI